jgi:hypothetical protein
VAQHADPQSLTVVTAWRDRQHFSMDGPPQAELIAGDSFKQVAEECGRSNHVGEIGLPFDRRLGLWQGRSGVSVRTLSGEGTRPYIRRVHLAHGCPGVRVPLQQL